jgi:Ubiquitin carboxyl-terminal hydrolase
MLQAAGIFDSRHGRAVSSSPHPRISETLLSLVHQVNGTSDRRQINALPLLNIVAATNLQFQSGSSTAASRWLWGKKQPFSLGHEQQDAQELLQAITQMIAHDARLDSSSSCCSTTLPLKIEPEDIDDVLTLVNCHKRNRRDRAKSGESFADCDQSPTVAVNGDKLKPAFHLGSLSPISASPVDVRQIQVANGITDVNLAQDMLNTLDISNATRIMMTTTNSLTPSPMCGWMGSTLMCRSCQHVRPIQNTPFYDIPAIPTAVSEFFQQNTPSTRGNSSPQPLRKHGASLTGKPCRLEDCLRDFTSVEHVSNVECRSCSLRRETDEVQMEVNILEGQIEAAKRSFTKSGGQSPSLAFLNDLRRDLEMQNSLLLSLKQANPDVELVEPANAGGEPHESVAVIPPQRPGIRSDAWKCLMISRLPAILCIHVQRRYYDPIANRMSKTIQHVQFPEILNVAPYCMYSASGLRRAEWAGSKTSSAHSTMGDNIPYRLVALIEHQGDAFRGHYVCYRRHPESENWYLVSDELTTPISFEDVQYKQAYMLFYEAV